MGNEFRAANIFFVMLFRLSGFFRYPARLDIEIMNVDVYNGKDIATFSGSHPEPGKVSVTYRV